MTEHCPDDGAFVGDAGCTHPNHRHSGLVQGLIADGKAKKTRMISEEDCDAALTEGFYVDGPNGKRIGFGRKLLGHINGHDPEIASDRKRKLLYAVNTVMFPERSEGGHRLISGRTSYFKRFDGFGIQAITSKEGDRVEYVFTHVVKYGKGSRKQKARAACPSGGAISATGSRVVSQTARPTAFPPRSGQAPSGPITDAMHVATPAPKAQAVFLKRR